MRPLFHAEDLVRNAEPNTYVGSPMYDVIPEHEPAGLAVLLLVAAAWYLRRRSYKGSHRATARLEQYRALPITKRLLWWLLASSAAVHGGLVLGHEPSYYTALYAADAALLGWASYRLLSGSRWRRWAALVLLGSIIGYAVSAFAGEPPDQVGIATKLLELTALAIVLRPAPDRRARKLLSSTVVIGLFVFTALAAWVGAFSSGGGHHLGEVPGPGSLIPAGEDRPPTPAEQAAADELYRATRAALVKYQDASVAAAHGYNVDHMYGRDFHADNPLYINDGHVLDPEKPETLVYAVVDSQPVLLGAMFQMPGINNPGPAVGGPITVWHAHDHICFSLTPPALSGLQSPFGTCPVGSINMPITNEMIHVWTLPGAPDPFGDLEDEWLDEYLAGMS